jgi:3-oxoacyl-[acyl-carrier protein] reductase
MDLGLNGRVVLVTGGGSGFGQAIAQVMAGQGCIVAVADRDPAAADRAAAACRTRGAKAYAFEVDVGDAGAVDAMTVAAARSCGRIDVLVNCAGILKTGSILESKWDDWGDVSRVNLSGVLHCARAAAPIMCAQKWGRIINIASISAMRGGGVFGNTLYATTKAGVIALTMGLARELGPSGITVNAIAPGLADTPMTRTCLSPENRAAALARIPLGRLATPADIANAALFLASDLASYVNGTVLVVDGGILTT